jgi:hypothetical protein
MWSSPDEPPQPEIVVLGERLTAAFAVPDGVRPVALWASGAGDVYAVAARDPEESTSPSARYEGPAYALRWSVDGGHPEALYALPERNGLRPQAGDVRLIFEIDGVVHVGGGVGDDAAEMFTPYLAREGDEGWTLAPLPDQMKGMLAAVAPARDASSFFTTSEEMGPGNGARWVAGRGDMAGTGSLWQRLGDGHWRRVKVELDRQPKHASSSWTFAPHGVAIAGDTLWITAGVAGHEALSSEDTGHVLGHAKVPD